jgi:seryl-tRNA(Sec) selenium transferase
MLKQLRLIDVLSASAAKWEQRLGLLWGEFLAWNKGDGVGQDELIDLVGAFADMAIAGQWTEEVDEAFKHFVDEVEKNIVRFLATKSLKEFNDAQVEFEEIRKESFDRFQQKQIQKKFEAFKTELTKTPTEAEVRVR